MELLPLPNFYHWVYLMLAGVVVAGIALWWLGSKKTKPKPAIEEMIQTIQRLAPEDPKTKELLTKLIPYRYDPKAGPIPKTLLKELRAHYTSVQKRRIINKNCKWNESFGRGARKFNVGP